MTTAASKLTGPRAVPARSGGHDQHFRGSQSILRCLIMAGIPDFKDSLPGYHRRRIPSH
jgi:hypothetical protein